MGTKSPPSGQNKKQGKSLKEMGIESPEDDPGVRVSPSNGTGQSLFFQLVPDAKVGKNRLHLDLLAPDVNAETNRLCGLGASVVARHHDDAGDHVVMADPEGNEFCLYPL